jgi:hypothetical protein
LGIPAIFNGQFVKFLKHALRLGSLASAPTSPNAGDTYYDSTLNSLRFYNGTSWVNASAGTSPTATYWAGYFGNASGWTTTSSGFVNGTNSGGNTLTTRQSSGLTVTATGSNACGVDFTPASASDIYLVTITFTGTGTTSGAGATFRVTDGTTTVATASNQAGSAADYQNNTMCGIFAPGTTSTVSLTVQLAAQSGGTAVITGIPSDLNPVMEWSIVKIV